MKTGPYETWAWHGMAEPEAYEAVCTGRETLKISGDAFAHDPGDFGRAVYLTEEKAVAKAYAATIGRTRAVVRAKARLERAIWLDFRKKRDEAWRFLEEMTARHGDTVRGGREERLAAAWRWRESILESGMDGMVVDDYDSRRTLVVYEPGRSILDISCPRIT